MRVYETTFIINPQMEDATIDSKVNVVSEIITKNNGKILHADHMGTRKLAYAIQGLSQGYYASFIYQAEANLPKNLERHFKLDESYLRHLTVIYEGDVVEQKRRSAEKARLEAERAAENAEFTQTPNKRRFNSNDDSENADKTAEISSDVDTDDVLIDDNRTNDDDVL